MARLAYPTHIIILCICKQSLAYTEDWEDVERLGEGCDIEVALGSKYLVLLSYETNSIYARYYAADTVLLKFIL